MTWSENESKAIKFATKAHEGQVRKYTSEPYIVHPIAVATIVKTVPHSEDMVMAAILHDVIEDCHVTKNEIETEFGQPVADLVWMLTDQCNGKDGNRRTRKEKEAIRIGGTTPKAKTIKIADCIHNADSIFTYDSKFSVVYHAEVSRLLIYLQEGDGKLYAKLVSTLNNYELGVYNKHLQRIGIFNGD